MRTFFILLKKEVRELLNWQFVLPMLVTTILFVGLGQVIGHEQERAKSNQSVIIVDLDQGAASSTISHTLSQAGFKPITSTNSDPATLIKEAKAQNAQAVLIVPAGFGLGLSIGQQQTIQTYSIIRNFSVLGNLSGNVIDSVTTVLNQYFGSQLINLQTSLQPEAVLNPIKLDQHVAVKDRIASGSSQDVLGYVNSQISLIPIILFIVIMSAAQMIATAISSEKENKTLETLLTLPISRKQLVSTKMLAAGLVALLAAGIYMVGFRIYMQGLLGDASTATEATKATVESLGISLGSTDYLWLGIALFLGILVALAMAMILGTFAEDVKSVQGLITPLMVLILIPYLVSLLLNIDQMSPVVKGLFYLIPFSHTFMAAPNLLLDQDSAVYLGIGYQLVVFLFFVYIAAKIFTTDRIITLKINFGKKKQEGHGDSRTSH